MCGLLAVSMLSELEERKGEEKEEKRKGYGQILLYDSGYGM